MATRRELFGRADWARLSQVGTTNVALPVMRRGWERPWITVVLGVVALGTLLAPRLHAASRRTPVVEAVQKVQPCVVSISSEKKAASTSRWPFSAEENQRPRVNGMGTG